MREARREKRRHRARVTLERPQERRAEEDERHDRARRVGTLSNLAGSGKIYTFDIVPISNGGVTINIAAGVAQDSAGNGNTAADQFSLTYDNVAPTLVISAPSMAVTRTGPVTYSVVYNGADKITLAHADITLNTTGTVSATISVSGSNTVTRTVTLSGISGIGSVFLCFSCWY